MSPSVTSFQSATQRPQAKLLKSARRTEDRTTNMERVKLRSAFFSVVAMILDKAPMRETLHCTVGGLQPKSLRIRQSRPDGNFF